MRAKLQAMDDLRRNKALTAAARLVGLEIFSRVNKASKCAWPSEETIADCLGIVDRTVRRAIKQLIEASEISVMRRGRSNVYFPTFVDRMEDNMSGVNGSTTPDNFDTDTGQKQHATPDKNDPLILKENSVMNSVGVCGEKRERQARRQQAENAIAEIVGRDCLAEAPVEEVEALCFRWPDIEEVELTEFKLKYAATGR
jgi:Helix-turn-helix domain